LSSPIITFLKVDHGKFLSFAKNFNYGLFVLRVEIQILSSLESLNNYHKGLDI